MRIQNVCLTRSRRVERSATSRPRRPSIEEVPKSELSDQLQRAHELFGEDEYEHAYRAAGAAARRRTARVPDERVDSLDESVDVGLDESYLVPSQVYLECLEAELRRLRPQ